MHGMVERFVFDGKQFARITHISLFVYIHLFLQVSKRRWSF